jgi:predicted ATPase
MLPAPLPHDLHIPRDAELAALAALCAQHPLVTVIGEPGVGKSALALAWARSQQRVTYIDLSSVAARTGDELERHLLAHLDAPHPAALHSAHLILDNADRVISLLAPLIARWSPQPRLLVTSRQPTRAPAERAFEVAPLAPAPALRLFIAHARHVQPTFDPDAAQLHTARRILEALDGNPLAIELAACRVRLLSLDQLLDRLRSRIDILRRTGPLPQLGARYETLRAAFDDAWIELSAPAQRVYEAAAIFHGSFALEALEALNAAPQADVMDLLHTLLERSLVRRVPTDQREARYMLPGSLRLYALAMLAQDAAEPTLRAAHAAHFMALGARALALIERDQLDEATHILGPDIDNIVAAWHHAREHDAPRTQQLDALFNRLSSARQGTTGVLTLLGACLDLALAQPEDARAHAQQLHLRAERLIKSGQSAAALRDLDEATRLLHDRDEPRLSATLHQTMAAVHIRSGQLDAARYHYERALLQADDESRPRILARLGRVASSLGDHPRAQETLQEALNLIRANPSADTQDVSEAKLLSYLASLRLSQGRLDEVRRLSQEALLANRLRPDPRVEASAREHLGLVAHELGDLIDASRHYQLAHAADQRSASENIPLALRLGHLALDHRQPAAARAHFDTILRSNAAREVPLAYGLACLGSALCELSNARPAHACDLFEQAARRFQTQRLHTLEGLTHAFHAIALALEAQHGAAKEALDLARMRLHEPTSWVALTLDLISQLLSTLQDPSTNATLLHRADRAQEAVEQACDRFEPSPHGITDARLRFTIDLAQHLANESPAPAALPDAASLVVEASGAWFRLPGESSRVELRRKRVLRRLLEALVIKRQREPGGVLTSEDLIMAGWPDERFTLNDSAHNRLYVALNRLRAEGLELLLQTERDGYRLDPKIILNVLTE